MRTKRPFKVEKSIFHHFYIALGRQKLSQTWERNFDDVKTKCLKLGIIGADEDPFNLLKFQLYPHRTNAFIF